MTSPRHPRQRTCDDLGAESAYPVLESVSGETPGLRSALAGLSLALRAVPSPVGSAVRSLVQSDIEQALHSLPARGRRHLLGALRIPVSGARVSPALCRDILARMQREPDSARTRHAAHHVCEALFDDLAVAVHLGTAGGNADRSGTLTQRWSPALLRLAAWTAFRAAAADAPAWLWALGQPWMTDDGTSDFAEAVRDAARKVMAADQGPASAAGTGEPAERPTAYSLDTACDRVARALRAAADPARRIADAVANAARPVDADMTAVAEVTAAFDAVLAVLAEHQVTPRSADLAAVRDATASLLTSLADADLRDRLRTVGRLRAVPGQVVAAEVLARAHERAAELRALDEWDERAGDDAAALAALLDMVELAHGEDDRSGEILAHLAGMSAKAPWLVILAAQHQALVTGEEEQPERGDGVDATGPAHSLPAQRDHHLSPETPPVGRRPAPELSTPAAQTPAPRAEPDVPRQAAAPGPEDEPGSTAPAVPTAREAETGPQGHRELAALVRSHRYGLAAALSGQAGAPPHRTAVLRIAAYAHALRSAGGGCASHIQAELLTTDMEELARSRPDAALGTASLLRTVLLTGEPEIGAPLGRIALELPPSLGTIAREVSQRALRSTLLHSPPLALARGAAELEKALDEAREECREALKQAPRLRFNRASEIARRWLAPTGLIGRLLAGAAEDDRGALDRVAAAVRELTDDATLQQHLNEIDRTLMRSSRSRLEGPARQDLLRMMNERLHHVEKWVAGARALNAGTADWSADQVQEMRGTVLALRDSVLDDLRGQARLEGEYGAAAIEAAADSLRTTFRLLAGDARLGQEEPPPALVLGGEVLKMPGARLDPDGGGVVVPRLPAAEFAAAADRSWEDAVRAHVADDRFDAATAIVRLAERDHLPGGAVALPGDVLALVAERGKEVAAELDAARGRIEERVRSARVNGVLKEDQEREFERRVHAARVTPADDLRAAREQLRTLAEELERAHAAATAKLHARLTEIPGLDPADLARVTPLLDDGDLLTADDLISHLANGESIPDIQQAGQALDAFFPGVPDALPDGITPRLIEAVRDRRRFPGVETLDYTRLSAEFAEIAAEGLRGWLGMASRQAGQRHFSEEGLLMPALRLIGYHSRLKPHRERHKSRSANHRFVHISEVRHTGDALVPPFGSDLRGGLDVMLVWGQPTAEALIARVRQDPGHNALLVAYFGTMPSAYRAALAVQCVGGRPLVVLDDAALAHLAAHGNQLLDPAMRVLLPFSAVNPYVSEKRGRVPEEMFFGRSDELASVVNPTGNQVVFGGRGLGKSALLKEAGRKFTAEARTGHVSLVLSLDSAFTGTNAPSETVWTTIGRRLADLGVLTVPRRLGADAAISYDRVLSGVNAWLKDDHGRRLLIMLDEADGFFEADSPRFTQTRLLRDLTSATDDGVKVVFAGLHSVQRYATIAVNNPFSHLSQHPRPIGPLRPQDAADLLIKPLSLLGYRFTEPALVHRILGHCSYQPFLLQMFAHRLVRTMHARRRDGLPGPPWDIGRADVELVQSDNELRRSITSAFHDTLRLDSRYNVIGNVVAHHAHHHGIDAHLSQAQLRDECIYWWAEGFQDLDPDQFRAYLTEMEGLGVLAPDMRRGWHLRSANALSMIGALEDVEAQLQNVASREVTERLTAMEIRHRSAVTHSHCPLTAAQIADVLPGRGNAARVVIGTPATGIDRVVPGLQEIAGMTGWIMPRVTKRSDFLAELVGGEPGTSRVVVSDLTAKTPGAESCLQTLDSALTRVPGGAGVSRTAVVVAGPGQAELWAAVLADGDEADVHAVPLRRFTSSGLRTWALDQDGVFSGDTSLEQLERVTGGWPLLVDRLAVLLAGGTSASEALRTISDELGTREGAVGFVASAGLAPGMPLRAPFASVVGYMGEEGLSTEDLQAAVEEVACEPFGGAVETVRALRAMQVLSAASSGLYRVEPVLRACWERAGR
ncbi:hypothetical protein ACL02R_13590 [Streptomyces sp. MS19]|uniref:hypothetical protein n=1 Tax=Streptomyces sp. MS19 TaxID=3385972 RepID=UPI0039A205E1